MRSAIVALAVVASDLGVATVATANPTDTAPRSAPTTAAGRDATAVERSPAVPFAAMVEHEFVRHQANGISRIERWREQMTRTATEVWIERIPSRGPAPVQRHEADDAVDRAAEASREHTGHRHLDAGGSARWIRIDDRGAVSLLLVDRRQRQVVEIPRAEFGTMGFDGRFGMAASLIPPAALSALQPMDADGDPAVDADEARWYEGRAGGWHHRVLWSEHRRIAMEIRSRRDDGNAERSVRVRMQPAPDRPPWQRLQGYTARRYDEFMD